jgi:cellulose synthase/poly-beta-1,6-N-acetylglucosamine synthase-like glycosyltransferase
VKIGPDRVGFVVIGRNEGARLEACLRSILPISSWIVYADSASTDGSPELAARLGAAVVTLPNDGKLTAARGRMAGYAELRNRHPNSEAVMFLDGDCILQLEFIPAALAFLDEHPHVAVVCGRRFEAHPDASVYNGLCDAEWNTPIGEATECGGDALVRCAALDAIGGYNPALRAGEEPEMTARMRAAGWRIWRIDSPMTEHDARILSLGQWWKRTQRGGFGYAQVWSATARLPQRLYGRQLRSAFLWAVLLPLIVVIAAVAFGRPLLLLFLPLAYAVQLFRIAERSKEPGRWTRAGLTLLAKAPESIGAARFLIAGAGRGVADYKGQG